MTACLVRIRLKFLISVFYFPCILIILSLIHISAGNSISIDDPHTLAQFSSVLLVCDTGIHEPVTDDDLSCFHRRSDHIMNMLSAGSRKMCIRDSP